jgi:hypothetical protein
MKKYIIPLLFIFIAAPVFASDATEYSSNMVSGETWYVGQFDKLALDVVIPSGNPGGTDILDALTVKNEGNARYASGIKELHLWLDYGTQGFQGWGTDVDLGAGTYTGPQTGWYWENLDVAVPADGRRLFVSVDVWESPPASSVNYTVQLGLPDLNDINENGEFDADESGVFMASKNNGPVGGAVINGTNQTIGYANSDVAGPKVIMTNLKNDQVLTDSSYVIQGEARDQGNSSPEYVKIRISKDGEPTAGLQDVDILTDNYSTWEYNWDNISDGTYYVQTQSRDFLGYESSTTSITVIVNKGGELSQEYSSVSLNKTTAYADGEDAIDVNVTLRNQDDYPIENKTIYLKEIREDGDVTIKSSGSGVIGQVLFSLKATEPTSGTFKITLGEDSVGSPFTITFLEKPAPMPVVEGVIDYEVGQWIKLDGHPAVYFLDSENLRHAYPVQAVWESYFGEDFSRVNTIDAVTMASYPLGRNVPFKIGTLMKLPTVPKVYKVEEGAIMRWVPTEAIATANFGENWASLIKLIPDSFISDYTVGTDIE